MGLGNGVLCYPKLNYPYQWNPHIRSSIRSSSSSSLQPPSLRYSSFLFYNQPISHFALSLVVILLYLLGSNLQSNIWWYLQICCAWSWFCRTVCSLAFVEGNPTPPPHLFLVCYIYISMNLESHVSDLGVEKTVPQFKFVLWTALPSSFFPHPKRPMWDINYGRTFWVWPYWAYEIAKLGPAIDTPFFELMFKLLIL